MGVNRLFKQLMKSIFASETKPKDTFENIYGLDTAKRLLQQHLHAPKPASAILDSFPGLGKTEILRSIDSAYPGQCVWIHGNTKPTAAGTIEKIYNKIKIQTKKRIIILFDEIEKGGKVSDVLLNVIEGGTLDKTVKTDMIDLKGINICLIGTCNDMKTLKRTQPALIDRVTIIHVNKPTDEEFQMIAVKRLARDNIPAAVASDIATQVLAVWGPNMRQVVKVANISGGADIDQTIQDMKSVGVDQ